MSGKVVEGGAFVMQNVSAAAKAAGVVAPIESKWVHPAAPFGTPEEELPLYVYRGAGCYASHGKKADRCALNQDRDQLVINPSHGAMYGGYKKAWEACLKAVGKSRGGYINAE